MNWPRSLAGDGRPLPPRDAADGVDADTAPKPDSVGVGSVDGVSGVDLVHAYTRRQAIADAVLVDVTRQASPAEMHGGFRVQVAVTVALWAAIEAIPSSLRGIADSRGRLHDVLWMAGLAVRRASVAFAVHLPIAGTRKRVHQLRVDVGPDDDGMPCITIGFPEDF
jgi:hypothetical protein